MSAKAIISRRVFRGQEYFGCEVFLDDRRVFKVPETENLQAVRLDILDWSRRQGKTVEWEYPKALTNSR